MVEMQLATENGGDSLKNFAEVAGMSSDEFSKAFKDDAAGAITSFIEGLSTAEDRGISAIKVLDDMGITEVRLRDTLLRAANASGVFSDALDMGATAWDENTALAEEAGKRYETVESQMAMLKNEVIDVAIEFGGPFLGALRDSIQAAKPLIESMGNVARKFSEMDVETQRSIMKFTGFIAIIGPVSKALGGLFKLVGGGMSVFGSLSKKIGILTAGSKVASGAIAGVGTSATTAIGAGSVGVAGFGTAIAGLAAPIAIGVAAIGTVATAVYLGKKAYDEHQLSGAKWGTAVTEEQDKVISKSYELREKAVGYVNEYADGVKGSADKAVEANNAIVESIQATIDKEYERKVKNAEEVENKEISGSLKQQAENDKRNDEALLSQAKVRVDRINQILTNASKNNRELSDNERQYIENNYNQLSDKQLELANFDKNQRIAIQSAYQDDLTKLSAKERETRANNVSKALNKELESYEKQRQKILDGTENNVHRRKALLDQQDKDHKNSTESMILGLAKLRKAQGYDLDSMSDVWEMYGWTVGEVSALVSSDANKTVQNLDMLANGVGEADIRWNELAFDPKTGEVRTNMADMLKEIAETDEGWEQLKFIAKNADISSNAKEEIAIAMGQSEKWNDLWLSEKMLLLDNNEAMVSLYDSINELGAWDTYNADRKTLGIDNADAMYSLMDSKGMLEEWIVLPVEIKTLLAEDPATLTVEEARQALEFYEELEPETKKLLGENTDVNNKLRAAEEKLNIYEKNKPGPKRLHATDNASGPASKATEGVKEFSRQGDHTVTLTTKRVNINDERRYINGNPSGPYATNATGNPYFQGGQTWLGDGGKREPYLTPQGEFGISPASWTLYDLPRGTKIWPSIQKMMDTFPRYEKGTQFDDTRLSRIGDWFTSGDKSSQSVINQTSLVSKMDELIFYLKKQNDRPIIVKSEGDLVLSDGDKLGRFVAKPVSKYNNQAESQNVRLRGGNRR